jgi:hypothetical protein
MKLNLLLLAFLFLFSSCSTKNGKIIITDKQGFGRVGKEVYLENTSKDTKIIFTIKEEMVVKTTERTFDAYKYAKAENTVETETYTLNPGELVLIGHTDGWGGNMDVRYDYEYSFSIVGQLEE